MPDLYTWARRWGIPFEAIAELRQQMGVDPIRDAVTDAVTEAGASQRVRLAFARSDGLLFRNNVGAMQDPETGRVVRYGLANESPQMNKRIKSSDLIGIQPVTITLAMVGGVIGQFVAREVKKPGWTYTGAGREAAQLKYLELVISKGGDAAFTTGS